RPYPRVSRGIVDDDRRDEAGLQRHFPAREAVVTVALEPRIGAFARTGPRPARRHLEHLGADGRGGRRIDGLPQGMSELIVIAEPYGAGNLEDDDAVFDGLLVASRPNAALVKSQLVVDAERP